MGLATAKEEKIQEKEEATPIPDYLIAEIVKGRPLYYKGYKDVINGTKTIEEIKMESKLQSWLKAQITGLLFMLLRDKPYDIFTGELGLNLPENTKRGADIAIFNNKEVAIDEFFANLPPEIIIEIDVAIDTEKQSDMDYVHQKIDDYLKFGVKKVVWIFSKTKKVLVADKTAPWLTYNWDKEIELIEDVHLNLNQLMERK